MRPCWPGLRDSGVWVCVLRSHARVIFRPAAEAIRTTSRASREPNPQDVPHVLQVAGEQREPAIAVVAPAHRHLTDAITGPAGQVQYLDVEHVAVDELAAEQGKGGMPLKELEAALRVSNVWQPDDRMNQKCESLRPEAPVSRLRALDRRGAHPAGSDDDLMSGGEQGRNLVEFADRRLVIRVDEPDHFPAGHQNTLPDAEPFAPARDAADHLERRVRLSAPRDLLTRTIVTIGSDDDLVAIAAARHI